MKKNKIALAGLFLWANDLRKSKPAGITINPKSKVKMFDIINAYLPSVGYSIHWRDTDFEVVDIKWWYKVLEQPIWTADDIKYVAEVADCEAFSLFFLSICELFLRTNGVFSLSAICKWTEKAGVKSSSHRCNVIVATENGNVGMWLFEPMYNKITKIEKGQGQIILNNVFGLNQMIYIANMIVE
jgi:hypothetical protein